jgi:photosystem II stability/assembly factor-like uncharacterized protein
MTVTAPPPAPPAEDPALAELADELRALIEEARRRQRRRRRLVVAVMLTAVAAAAAALLHDNGGVPVGRSVADASPQRAAAGAGDGRWGPSYGPEGAIVSSLVAGRDALYVATVAGGVYKSANRGASWHAINRGLTGLRVDAIAVDPVHSSTMYAGTGEGVFKSVNGGSSWSRASAGLFAIPPLISRQHRLVEGYVSSLLVDPRAVGTVYASTFTGSVYRSADGGGSWHPLAPLPKHAVISTFALDRDDPAVLYAGARYPGGVFKSEDAGHSWRGSGFADAPVGALAADPHESDTLYAATARGGVFRSTDAARSWQPLSSLTGTTIWQLLPETHVPGTIYAASSKGLLKTSDGGNRWQRVLTGSSDVAGVWAVALDARRQGTVFAGAGGGVVASTDSGGTWGVVNRGLAATNVRAVAIASPGGQLLYAATQWSGAFKSSDGGRSWRRLDVPANVSSVVVDPTRARTVYVGTDRSGLLASNDGGATWRQSNTGLTATRILSLAVDRQRGTVYAGTSGSGVFTSVNRGRSWRPTAVRSRVFSLAVAAGGRAYAGTGTGDIWTSSDGSTWRRLTSVRGRVDAVAGDPRHANILFAATTHALFKSSDGGATWQVTPGLGGGRALSVAFDSRRPDTVYAGTADGVARSTDGGRTWHPFGQGLSGWSVVALTISADGRRIFAGTTGAGVLDSMLAG